MYEVWRGFIENIRFNNLRGVAVTNGISRSYAAVVEINIDNVGFVADVGEWKSGRAAQFKKLAPLEAIQGELLNIFHHRGRPRQLILTGKPDSPRQKGSGGVCGPRSSRQHIGVGLDNLVAHAPHGGAIGKRHNRSFEKLTP